MAVVAFYTHGKEQAGNTVSALSLATYIGIVHNKRTLLISTALNDSKIKEALWPPQTKKRGIFVPVDNSTVNDNGIEGLDRISRSNRITPDIITDYTRVALKGRLEVLQGYSGSEDQYKEIQKQYLQIINLSKQIYDTVIVDVDRNLDNKTKLEILNQTDVVVAMTTQNLNNLESVQRTIAEGIMLKKNNTLITLGKYDNKSKFNLKNISRNIIRTKEMINTVPYNTVLFDDVQEGKIIDLFIRLLELSEKDENTFFIDEIKRLNENIDKKASLVQQTRKQI